MKFLFVSASLAILAVEQIAAHLSARQFHPLALREKVTSAFSALHPRTVQVPTKNLNTKWQYLNIKTQRFWVDGKRLPEIDWDVGESYAGLLPVSKERREDKKLYWWFWPTINEDKGDILIWLNGGPGCSSLEGMFQENGPFTWKWGEFKPHKNQYSWHNLTNVLYVEQPVGTGFTQGTPTATSEEDVAEQFLGFFENFIDTFGLYNKKIYVTGESYAGAYVPYIVDAMHKRKNKKYFNVKGLMIYNPYIADMTMQQQLPAARYMDEFSILFPLDEIKKEEIRHASEICGYEKFINETLQYPPVVPPRVLNAPAKIGNISCAVWDTVFAAVLKKNPCFNAYRITDTCPVLYDPLGFPGSFPYLEPGTEIYFNRTDVQKRINAPVGSKWTLCSDIDVFVNGTDTSAPTTYEVLPRVIPKNERTIISQGTHDFVIMTEGVEIAIQNMTWSGKQGFQTKPSSPFYVPYDGQGNLGVVHTERKLTYIEVELAGHMVPQFQPGATYHQVEYLLGRKKEEDLRPPKAVREHDL